MANLIYSAIASLDGYTTDPAGSFDWAAPDEEVHSFINQRERSIGTYLYGRRMYETMRYWESTAAGESDSAVEREYAGIWRAAQKVVYSRTLAGASTARTRIEPEFSADAVATMVASAETDVAIGGPTLAAEALRSGVVNTLELYLVPIAVGGGTRALPADLALDLELRTETRFASGFVYVAYAVRGR